VEVSYVEGIIRAIAPKSLVVRQLGGALGDEVLRSARLLLRLPTTAAYYGYGGDPCLRHQQGVDAWGYAR
jgi:hypothetical protein